MLLGVLLSLEPQPANAANEKTTAKATQQVIVLLDPRDKKLKPKDLVKEVKDGKLSSSQGKELKDAIDAEAVLWRDPTPREREVIDRAPDSPLAHLHHYVVVTYLDEATAKDKKEKIKVGKKFLHVPGPINFLTRPLSNID